MRSSKPGDLLVRMALLLGLALAPAAAQPSADRTLTGTLEMLWGEGPDRASCVSRYRLFMGNKDRIALDISPGMWASLSSRVGEQVVVRGDFMKSAASADAPETFQVRTVSTAREDEGQVASRSGPALGRKPYLTILCRFADTRNKTPKPASYFQRLVTDRRHGLAAYFRQVSYGALSIEGSASVGWLDLPRPLSAYRPGPNFDFDRALADAVSAAGRQVAVDAFDGINLVFNVPAFGNAFGGFGGRFVVETEGEEKVYGVTWLSYTDQALFAHEMGHSLGLPHSSGPYNRTYDSDWDVMSQSYLTRTGKLGYVAQDTIAYHKRLLGWIPDAGVTAIARGIRQRVNLRPLCHSRSGCQLVMIPLSADGSRFYTVEARLRAGLDKKVPGSGVVIHRVDTNRGDRVAEVVDADRNGNPNDRGSLWIPGERFQDSGTGVSVRVVGRSGDEFVIDVETGS